MKRYAVYVFCGLLMACILLAQGSAFSVTKLTDGATEARVEELLKMMTLEEKLGQMNQLSDGQSPICLEAMTAAEKASEQSRNEALRKAYRRLAREGKLGSMLNCIGAEKTNELQRAAVSESRLGIPLIFGYDVIHGYRTEFPIPLGLAATWDPALVERTARIAAIEASSEGVHWTFSPMVDIARDPRWGRVAEGAGEDTYLGCRMAEAQVRGYQTSDLASPGAIAACAKHYVGYGAAIAGRDYNTVDMSERTLRETYLPPFEAAVREGVATLMSAFNDLGGVPTSGNRHTLDEILRKEWGFKGFVVSDWESIGQLVPHGFALDRAQAGLEAVMAGVDMDMADGIYLEQLPELVAKRHVPMKVIDESVRRILRVKIMKGLFENPYTDPARAQSVLLAPAHREVALEAAERSMVLLKNDKSLLPLKKDIPALAVIGPLADDRQNLLGSWTAQGRAQDTETIIERIRAHAAPKCKVTYARGCAIEGDASKKEIDEAVKAAKKAKVALLFLGERGDMSGEAASRTSLDLPGAQQRLLEAVKATGTPVVLVMLNGRPLTIPWAAEHVPAIVEAWFPGTMAGEAIARLVFGEMNPGGRLPMSFPRSTGQIPVYYNSKNTGRPANPADKFTSKYLDSPNTPLYAFGHGLSYTTFAYRDLRASEQRISTEGELTVKVLVKNTGLLAGDEVVQLYIRDLVASATRPVKELKGFTRIRLAPGEEREVSFTLTADSLAFWNRDMRYTVEPGKFAIYVGGSSQTALETHVSVLELEK